MRIDPSLHPWMTAPETVEVFAALGAELGAVVNGDRY